MAQEIQNNENNNTKKRSLFHKIFGLKGLSNIYKILSILPILWMIYLLVVLWINIKNAMGSGVPNLVVNGLVESVFIIFTYLFISLVLYTIARVLKVLKKIQHAVNNK